MVLIQSFRFLSFVMFANLAISPAYSEHALYRLPVEEIYLEPQATIAHVRHKSLQKSKRIQRKKTFVGYREYHMPVSDSEKKDMRFILKALAQKSLTSLWGSKTQLEHAGERIDHVHPLKFLEVIFTEDELKVYVHNIKKRGGWIWGEFVKGFKDSFKEETQIGNMNVEFVEEFSNHVNIDLSLIYDVIQAGRWEDLIKSLIIYVPRSGDPSRYDQ